MLFRKRDKKPGMAAHVQHDGSGLAGESAVYRIDEDMMLKGSVVKRGKRTIRQFGVTVNGSTRLVTCGDLVDRETYEALLAVGAIRPVNAPERSNPDRAPGGDPA